MHTVNSRQDVLELLGAVAVAFDEGARLGKVSDIYVDRDGCRLQGVAITTPTAVRIRTPVLR